MSIKRITPLLAGIALLSVGFIGYTSFSADEDKVVLAQLAIDPIPDPDKAYLSEYELKRIVLPLGPDSPLALLPEGLAADDDDKLATGGCFVPTHKLIYADYTYVLSTYCTNARKFKNTSAFVTGTQELPNDLVFTEPLLMYLEQLHAKNFKPEARAIYKRLSYTVRSTSMSTLLLEQIAEDISQQKDLNDELKQADDDSDDEKDVDSVAVDANKPTEPPRDDDEEEEELGQLDKQNDEPQPAAKPAKATKPKKDGQ